MFSKYIFVFCLSIIVPLPNVFASLDAALGALQQNLKELGDEVRKANVQKRFTKEQKDDIENVMKLLRAAKNETSFKQMAQEEVYKQFDTAIDAFLGGKLSFINDYNMNLVKSYRTFECLVEDHSDRPPLLGLSSAMRDFWRDLEKERGNPLIESEEGFFQP